MVNRPILMNVAFTSLVLLNLTACTSSTQNQKLTTSQSAPVNVVLMDPGIDDSMLPALGEGLSKGAVTIYSLDGQAPPLPINVAQPAAPAVGPRPIITPPDFGVGYMPHPMMANGSGAVAPAPLSLTRPAKMAKGNNDPRVTLFNPDLGSSAAVKKTAPAPALRPPTLPPPLSDKTQPLKSPFAETGVLGTPRPPKMTENTPVWKAPVPHMGSDRRTVVTEDLMVPTLPPPLPSLESSGTKTTRPPKGMTY